MNWRVIATLPWLVFGLVWLVGAIFAKRTVRRESLTSRLTYTLPLACAAMLLFWRRLDGVLPMRVVPAGDATQIAGLAITSTGVALAVWARFHLGRLWSGVVTLKEGHRLVQTGPYALVRHPIYTGLLTAFLGTAVNVGTLRALVALLMATGSIIYKLSLEEKLMAESFGQEHAAYRRRVKRLVPFLW